MRKDAEGLRAQQEAEAARRTAGKMGMKAIEQQMQVRSQKGSAAAAAAREARPRSLICFPLCVLINQALPACAPRLSARSSPARAQHARAPAFPFFQDRLELQAEAEREFRRERDMVDEVVRRIQQEDAMEAAARRSKQVGAPRRWASRQAGSSGATGPGLLGARRPNARGLCRGCNGSGAACFRLLIAWGRIGGATASIAALALLCRRRPRRTLRGTFSSTWPRLRPRRRRPRARMPGLLSTGPWWVPSAVLGAWAQHGARTGARCGLVRHTRQLGLQ